MPRRDHHSAPHAGSSPKPDNTSSTTAVALPATVTLNFSGTQLSSDTQSQARKANTFLIREKNSLTFNTDLLDDFIKSGHIQVVVDDIKESPSAGVEIIRSILENGDCGFDASIKLAFDLQIKEKGADSAVQTTMANEENQMVKNGGHAAAVHTRMRKQVKKGKDAGVQTMMDMEEKQVTKKGQDAAVQTALEGGQKSGAKAVLVEQSSEPEPEADSEDGFEDAETKRLEVEEEESGVLAESDEVESLWECASRLVSEICGDLWMQRDSKDKAQLDKPALDEGLETFWECLSRLVSGNTTKDAVKPAAVGQGLRGIMKKALGAIPGPVLAAASDTTTKTTKQEARARQRKASKKRKAAAKDKAAEEKAAMEEVADGDEDEADANYKPSSSMFGALGGAKMVNKSRQ